MSYFDDEYDRAAALRRIRRHRHAPVLSFFLSLRLIPKKLMSSYTGMEECQKTNTTTAQFRILIINVHFVADNAYHALASSATRPTFNVDEEVVVFRSEWTPKKMKKTVSGLKLEEAF